MISRPVLRQHTPRYVSHPHRVVVLVAPPSTQEYPLDLEFLPLPASLSLLFSPFLIYLLSPLTFSQLILINCFTYPFLSFLPSTHFAVFLRRDIFLPNFFRFSRAFRTSCLLFLFPISRPLPVSLVPCYFHSSLSSRLSESYPPPHFLLSLISTYRSTLGPRSVTRRDPENSN